jgi:hypothetical protein
MVKRILFVVLVFVFLTGCMKPKTIKPGETAEITKTQEFYFGVLVTDDMEALQPLLEGKTEQEIIRLLVRYYGKYQILPEDMKTALLADMIWITTAGVSVEDPNVTLESIKLTWKERNGNTETTKTVDGYKLVISARIVASPEAESGDVILKMAQFKTLELANLYVVRIAAGGAQVVEDSDIYVVAQIE